MPMARSTATTPHAALARPLRGASWPVVGCACAMSPPPSSDDGCDASYLYPEVTAPTRGGSSSVRRLRDGGAQVLDEHQQQVRAAGGRVATEREVEVQRTQVRGDVAGEEERVSGAVGGEPGAAREPGHPRLEHLDGDQ